MADLPKKITTKMKTIKKEDISLLKAFGNKVKHGRKEAKLTQRELAEKVGVTHEWVCKIEKGKANSISFTLIAKISEALGWESSVLVFDDLSQFIEGGGTSKELLSQLKETE
jgi:transcriptional regulator with XRE-family HTH domain